MENDGEDREGAEAVQPLFESGAMTGMVIIAHDRGNCRPTMPAGKRLRRFPSFKHLLVIDDDEIADPTGWNGCARAAERFGADIVGGPQLPVFQGRSIRLGQPSDLYAALPIRRRRAALYSSGNLLSPHGAGAMPTPFLDLQVQLHGRRRFRLPEPVIAEGFQARLVPEAPVQEVVPPRRIEADWIRARSLRNGVISTLVERRSAPGPPFGNARVVAKSIALLRRLAARAVAATFEDRLALDRALSRLCRAWPDHGRIRICQ